MRIIIIHKWIITITIIIIIIIMSFMLLSLSCKIHRFLLLPEEVILILWQIFLQFFFKIKFLHEVAFFGREFNSNQTIWRAQQKENKIFRKEDRNLLWKYLYKNSHENIKWKAIIWWLEFNLVCRPHHHEESMRTITTTIILWNCLRFLIVLFSLKLFC